MILDMLTLKHILLQECSFKNSFPATIKRFYSYDFSNLIFNSEEKKRCIERLKNFKIQHKVSSSVPRKNASVLVPLCQVNGEVSLLYTLRKQDLKRHKGQVSFPGGTQDSGDSNLEKTALRETEEEIGVCQDLVEVWGHGNAVVAREFNIYPVVGCIGTVDVNNLKLNPSEVDLAFTVPLKHFCETKNVRYTQYRNGKGYVLPVYINGKCKIWGITALITHITLQALIPQEYTAQSILRLIKPVI